MSANTLKILLVEDSPSDAELMKSLLKDVVEFSFEVNHASSLATGLQILSSTRYDALVLDLGLPDSTGLETFLKVRGQDNEVPVVIVTGNDDREMLAEAMKSGADNYLIKDAFDGNRVAIAILAAIRMRASKSA